MLCARALLDAFIYTAAERSHEVIENVNRTLKKKGILPHPTPQ